MSNIKKISIVKPEGLNPSSFKGSLVTNGYVRFPNTFFKFAPYAETDGSYRTGLDENALYIRHIKDETAREQEKAIVRGLYERAKELYGDAEISPRSDFYKKMTDNLMNTDARCPFRKLSDGDTIFNLENKEDLISYAYIRVHPHVAPSKEALKFGQYSHCRYYVNDEEIENTRSFEVKQKINKAGKLLDSFSLEKRRKIGRQLGLTITDSTSEATAYTLIDDYIKQSEKVKYSSHVDLFLAFADMKDDALAVRDTVTQAITYNVLRKRPDGKLYRGELLFAASEKDAAIFLSDINNQEDLLTIEEELKRKKSIPR